MNLVLLGPSGVGKGTHAENLSARYHLRHLATGDLFRQNVRERTALGLQANGYMAQGELVPDEVVDAMTEEWADALPAIQGTLFDGFPRTEDQLHFLDELLSRLNRKLDAAIYLKVDDDEIVERLLGREICRNCQASYHLRARLPKFLGRCDRCGGELYRRPDDTPEVARARLRIFHRVTEPIIAHFASVGKLLIVSGTGTIAAVASRLEEAVDALADGSTHFATVEGLGGVSRAPAQTIPLPTTATAKVRLDLLLMGGPGSGKGTQAERLSGQLRIPHIATGDLFRENLRQATPLGKVAKGYMDRGELVPDDVTDAMIEERLALADTQGGFILDGFPRTMPQAQALTEMMTRLQRRLAGVLYIKVSDASIIGRLAGRLTCRKCQAPFHLRFKPPQQPGRCDHCGGELYQRSDDNPGTVAARLTTFHRQTEPLIAYYREAGLLHEIDGEGDVARISEESLAAIGRITRQFAIGPLIATAP